MSKTLDLLRQIQGEWLSLPDFSAFTIPGASIQATLRGLRINLDVVNNPDFVGVGIFHPHPQNRTASFVRAANRRETDAYLSQFPRIMAVLFQNKHSNWIGVSNRNVSPVYNVSDFTQDFETAMVFKIGDVWVYGSEFYEFPGVSSGLRVSFQNNDRVLLVRGATPDHRVAYFEKMDMFQSPKTVLPDAVSFMGGKLIDMVVRSDGTSLITYEVSRSTFTSLVETSTMKVISAGICLDGEDSNFDLTTLIPVIRKGVATNRIYRTGLDNGDFEDN